MIVALLRGHGEGSVDGGREEGIDSSMRQAVMSDWVC